MAPEVTAKRSSRIDLRMTEEQKRQIEEAAGINGTTVSQWAIGTLLESARRDIAEQGLMRLSAESFDEFARLLEGPSPASFERLRSSSTRWDA